MPKILVVDDEDDLRLLYADELQDEGYEVVTAGSGQEARQCLEREPFDLMILDIQMRGESGLDLLKEMVREREELPVILCTAFSMYKDDFSSWLADAYVVKSSDLSELKEQVRKALAKKKPA
ncbi:response regulator [Geoalkalibacter halelectricus]|uniref:Response regulator n=1 Tax=Geoalkalibacter halelectricus TaxID=2847045 RepID=A0ABY5ZND7_9BACT|nr:response regulator [Geoalkalibacter halelectricus]MDO3377587.1 response regulator [Geoalkalibacter halelectricus]UWZ80655.1 response regulator [Geoalkalibacter halelectricus]